MNKTEMMELVNNRKFVTRDISSLGGGKDVRMIARDFYNPEQYIEYSDFDRIFYEHGLLEELSVEEAIEKGAKVYLVSNSNIEKEEVKMRTVYDGYFNCDMVQKMHVITLKDEDKKARLYRKEVKVGLIEGRHPLPVNTYILKEVKNVLDFNTIEREVTDWINANITFKKVMGGAPNQCDYTDVQVFTSVERLVVYVTGLTAVTAALIKVCSEKGVKLTLMHYDREKDKYLPQIIF